MALAPSPGARAPVRLEAADPRADDRRRVVMLARDKIVIARGVEGVFMRIALKARAYRGVLLRLADLDEQGFHYEVHLAHRDPDFGVPLAQTTEESEARVAWGLWARYFELPMLVERVEGIYETERPMIGAVQFSAPGLRRKGRGFLKRRPRFLTRRKLGRPELGVPVEGTREIFGGWRDGV